MSRLDANTSQAICLCKWKAFSSWIPFRPFSDVLSKTAEPKWLEFYLLCMESNLLLHVTAFEIILTVRRIGDPRDESSSRGWNIKIPEIWSLSSPSSRLFCLMLRTQIILRCRLVPPHIILSENFVIEDYGCHLHIMRSEAQTSFILIGPWEMLRICVE